MKTTICSMALALTAVGCDPVVGYADIQYPDMRIETVLIRAEINPKDAPKSIPPLCRLYVDVNDNKRYDSRDITLEYTFCRRFEIE